MRSLLIIFLLICMAPQPLLAENEKIEKAKEVFETMVERAKMFDKSVADLYSDDAIIINRRHYPFGRIREMTMEGRKYKFMIGLTMPLAKKRKDISTFSNVNYEVEGEGVRVTATRYSELKKYSSPYSVFIKEDNNGNWLIFEETTESKP